MKLTVYVKDWGMKAAYLTVYVKGWVFDIDIRSVAVNAKVKFVIQSKGDEIRSPDLYIYWSVLVDEVDLYPCELTR